MDCVVRVALESSIERGRTQMRTRGRAALMAAAVTLTFPSSVGTYTDVLTEPVDVQFPYVDGLDACSGCGGRLALVVMTFARCTSCGAENYRPVGDEPAEAKVARFWRRSLVASQLAQAS